MKLENIGKANLIDGMKKSYSNAEELLNEVYLLQTNQKWARAYALCQLSIEEMAKVPLLFDLLINKINGYPIDYKQMNRKFKDHSLKTILSIETEIAFFKLYKQQSGAEWVDGAIKKGEEFINNIEELNDFKNESLYVTIKGNKFQSPNVIIDEEKFQSVYGKALLRKIMFKKLVEGSENNIEEIARMIKENYENDNVNVESS